MSSSPTKPLRADMPEAGVLVRAWREKMRDAKTLRAMYHRMARVEKIRGPQVEALWSGWYALTDAAADLEPNIVRNGGLLCLVAP